MASFDEGSTVFFSPYATAAAAAAAAGTNEQEAVTAAAAAVAAAKTATAVQTKAKTKGKSETSASAICEPVNAGQNHSRRNGRRQGLTDTARHVILHIVDPRF
jgi:hypothetical protein